MVLGLLVAGRRPPSFPSPVPTEVVGILGVIVGGSLITAQWNGVGLLTWRSSAAVLLGLALLPRSRAGAVRTVAVRALRRARPRWKRCRARSATSPLRLHLRPGQWPPSAADSSSWSPASRLTRLPAVVSACGGVLVLAGAAVTWNQVHGLAPILGILASLALIGSGLAWDSVRLSLLGSLGLLGNVLWALAWFFPGRARAPLLAVVAGAVVIAVAVLLSEANRHSRRRPPGGRAAHR